jgi:hypothetical protein
LSTQIIAEHQRKEQTLIQHQHNHPEYFSKTVDGHEVTLFNNKIYIPKTLRKQILSCNFVERGHQDMLHSDKLEDCDLIIKIHGHKL